MIPDPKRASSDTAPGQALQKLRPLDQDGHGTLICYRLLSCELSHRSHTFIPEVKLLAAAAKDAVPPSCRTRDRRPLSLQEDVAATGLQLSSLPASHAQCVRLHGVFVLTRGLLDREEVPARPAHARVVVLGVLLGDVDVGPQPLGLQLLPRRVGRRAAGRALVAQTRGAWLRGQTRVSSRIALSSGL